MRVSSPGEFEMTDRKGMIDYYHLGIKTDDGKRVIVYLTTTALGFSGDIAHSKMYYWNPDKKREVKTTFTQLERVIGYRFRVTGFLEIIDEKEKKYRMNRVQKCIIFLRPSTP